MTDLDLYIATGKQTTYITGKVNIVVKNVKQQLFKDEKSV